MRTACRGDSGYAADAYLCGLHAARNSFGCYSLTYAGKQRGAKGERHKGGRCVQILSLERYGRKGPVQERGAACRFHAQAFGGV